MSGSQRMVLAALLAVSSVVLSGQEQPASPAEPGARTAASVEAPFGGLASGSAAAAQEEQHWAPCDVGGIYRPFSLVRRLKLATAYFVNPTLPQTARIVHAYSLEEAHQSPNSGDWLDKISQGEALLAAPVENDVAGALSPVQLLDGDYGAGGSTVLSPCRPLPSAESADRVPRVVHVPVAVGQSGSWIENLPEETRKRVHVLVFESDPLFDTTANRFVTWDPTEGVAESRSPEAGRQSP